MIDFLRKPGPHDVTVTVGLARRILELPMIAATDSLSVVRVYCALSERSKRSFETAVSHDQDLFNIWSSARVDFAALNGYESWPELDAKDILEEVFVEAGELSHLVYAIDGRRYVRVNTKLWTFREFREIYGRSVTSHVNSLAYDRIRRMQRALELLQIECPFEIRANFVSDAGAQELSMRVYDLTQAVEYARRNHMVCCAIDGETPPSES